MKHLLMTTAITSVSMTMMAAGSPDVTGTIVDNNGEPMSFVNVVLLSKTDSAFVQGATSDENGKFNIVTPETGGILKISSIGYETLLTPVEGGQTPDGMVFVMKEDSKMLQEVSVSAQLPKTKLTGNSMVTSIEGSVLGKSGSAKEMLAKVPGMTQKGDALCLRASLQDALQLTSQKVEMDCGYYVLNQHTINNRQRLSVSLRYTFNAQQSKYKGSGAGKEAAGRMGI